MNKQRLIKRLSNFNKAKILVIGDLILDEFIWGSVSRISPEAPVPVVLVNSESFMPGGASNVASNIHALGGKAYVCGVVGDDRRGQILAEELRKKGIDAGGIAVDAERPTTLKTRVIAHSQQVVRIDKEMQNHIDEHVLDQLVTYAREKMSEVDGVVIEDYGKGVIVPGLLQEVISLAKKHKKIITVDPKDEHFFYYKGVTSITPNHYEAARAVGKQDVKDEKALKEIGLALLNKLKCKSVLITLGENGMCLFEEENKRITHIPTMAQEVFDVSGAGDTVIAAFTQALASGASLLEAAHISNFAAGIVVGKVGIAVSTIDELADRIKQGV